MALLRVETLLILTLLSWAVVCLRPLVLQGECRNKISHTMFIFCAPLHLPYITDSRGFPIPPLSVHIDTKFLLAARRGTLNETPSQ